MTPAAYAPTMAALEAAGGDYRRAAESLGVTVGALYGRLGYYRRVGLLPATRRGPAGWRVPLDKPPPLFVAAARRVLAGPFEEADAVLVFGWVYPDGQWTDRAARRAARWVLEEAGG